MAISLSSMSGSSNDFNINVTGAYTSVTLTKTMPAGSYSIASAAVDTTIDIYSYNADGSSAGYTSNKAFTASKTFNKLVILGGTTGDVLSFTFKTTYPSVNATSEVKAGPVITSVVTSSLPNINDTTTVTGRNFATDIEAKLTGSDSVDRTPKSLVRGSATSLVIIRPDDFPPAYSPYTLTLSNPGVSNPVGTNSHISSNSITSGAAPSWTTSAILTKYKISTAYSQAVVATDSDGGSSITYSVVSGSLPTGITFNTSTATYSGTSSVSSGTFTHTVRATDSGGNYVDRAFTIAPQVVPDAPTIGAATANATGSASIAFTAPSYVGSSSITGYTITSSSGSFTGTGSSSPITVAGMTAGTAYTFTIVATNSSGSSVASSASSSFTARTMNVVNITSNQTWTVPAGVTSFEAVAIAGGGGASYGYGGGGGGGGAAYKTFTTTPGSTFAVSIGAGGANAQPSQSTPGANGSHTTFGSITGYGGGGCRDYGSSSAGVAGGCGGGGATNTDGGTASQGAGGDIHYGNKGGSGGSYPPASVNNSGCGAGGGLGSAGVKGRGGAGLQFFGQSTWRGLGGRGHGYNTDPAWSNDGVDGVQPANSGNGAGSDANVGTTAASGVVILKYFS